MTLPLHLTSQIRQFPGLPFVSLIYKLLIKNIEVLIHGLTINNSIGNHDNEFILL